ncbi:MAG: signal peptidase I [Bacilli bacterium]|nr:signal peptidase I [Bacilli bacterium]
MKKNTKFIYMCELILLAYVILFTIFINYVSNDFKNIFTIIVLSFILIILLVFFGKKKDNNYLRGSSARIVITALMTFILVIYSLGIVLGFNRSYFNSNIIILIKNILPIALIIILIELVRYSIIRNSIKNKKIIVYFTILSAILSVLLEINIGNLTTSEDKFIFLSTIIFPIIAEETLCSYMSYKISFLPSIIYKLVIKLYIYIVPIVPNLGNYIYSVIYIVLPFIIYAILNKMVIKYEKEKQQLKKANRVVFTIPLTLFLVIIILLISGIFKYKMIAIMSNSMSPTYRRGDAIIYNKVDTSELKVDDILAFQKDGVVVTHRIVKVWKQGDSYYYTTKGDNNDTEDFFKPREENVLGRVEYVLKYLGYPTVIINEYFGKE